MPPLAKSAGLVLLLLAEIHLAGAGGVPLHSTNLPVKKETQVRQRGEVDSVQAHAHYALGVIREQAGEVEAALGEFLQAAVLDPASESLCLDVARRFLARNQPERALTVLECPASHSNASAEVFLQQGVAYVRLGRLSEAKAANHQAISRSPGDLAGYQNLYLILTDAGATSEAWEILDRAARVSDVDADFLVGLADLYVGLGKRTPTKKDLAKTAALNALDRAAKMKQVPPIVRLKLADGFNSLGEGAAASVIYAELLGELHEMPKVRDGVILRLVDLNLRAGNRKSAMKHLREALKSDPVNVQLLYQLGSLGWAERDYSTAEDAYRQILLLRPDWPPPYYELAQVQVSMGSAKAREALVVLEQARQRFSAVFVGEVLAGVAHVRLKEYEQAIASYLSAEALAKLEDPKRLNEGFYYQLGAAYERKGDLGLAESYLRKSLELAPNFADAMNYLGYMWADRGLKLDEAEALIKGALVAEPENAAYLDSLGWVYFKQQRTKEALPMILKAIELSPEPDATLLDHLGDVQSALGNRAAAREAWERSVAVEPAENVRKKLDSTPVK